MGELFDVHGGALPDKARSAGKLSERSTWRIDDRMAAAAEHIHGVIQRQVGEAAHTVFDTANMEKNGGYAAVRIPLHESTRAAVNAAVEAAYAELGAEKDSSESLMKRPGAFDGTSWPSALAAPEYYRGGTVPEHQRAGNRD
jgi:hypothetical protein